MDAERCTLLKRVPQMNVTLSSTAHRDQRLARRLPPDLLRQVYDDENELQALRAEAAAARQVAEHAQAESMAAARQAIEREQVDQMTARHVTNAQQRHQALEDAVMMVLQAQDGYRPLAAMTGAQRVDVVVKRLGDAPVKYGLPKGWKSSNRKERIVRKIVNTWFKSKL